MESTTIRSNWCWFQMRARLGGLRKALPYAVGHRRLSVASTTVVAMAKPTTPEASDRLGNPLPADPSVEDVEREVDRLRIVSDSRVSSETINRVSLDDLEQRRLRALGR